MKTLALNFLPICLAVLFSLVACSKGDTPNSDPAEDGEEQVLPPRNPIYDHVDSSFVVQGKTSAESEKVRLNQSFAPSDFIPIGWYATPNSKFKVNVKRLKGNTTPVLIIGTYNRERITQPPYTYQPQVISLVVGDNTINTGKGGLLFIRYEGDGSESIVSVVNGLKPAPFFQGGKTTNDIWRKMLVEFDQVPDVVMYKDKIMIVMNRDRAYDKVKENQNGMLDVMNRIWNYEEEISGLDDSSPKHIKNVHNHLMTEYDGDDYYMAATNYGTIYRKTDAAQLIASATEISGWGTWHELGHHHQQNAYLWNGMMEVTVNIYSLYTEKKLGLTPRYKKDNAWDNIDTYMNKNLADRDFDKDNVDKLAMFHQLTLAYGDNFYKTLHKQTREELPNNHTDLLKKRYFMLKACTISGHDLTDFFKEWGMVGVESVYPEMAALGLPKPTINPATLRE
ncbi:M60 family metallopeptidase [Sphingobacterium lumbrici]|uniref:M60 family metallopeptidase n=1 Tax=Sphingobacterium lumbrici TaxID=2559600 RepID=UPI0015E325A0|nr:M60 family metallopeptidase [Sphingobacterium lumbrici]